VNDRLLFMTDAVSPPPPPVPLPATGGFTPSTLGFTGATPVAYSVTVRVSEPVTTSLSAYLQGPGTWALLLGFMNPSLDRLTWTATGDLPSYLPRDVWTLTGIRGQTAPGGAAPTVTTFLPATPITVTLTDSPPVVTSPVTPPPVVPPPTATPIPVRTATALAIGATDGHGHALRRLARGRVGYVTAVLRSGSRGVNGARVLLQAHRSGRGWSTVATRTTATVNAVRGAAVLRVRPSATTYYRWVYRGSSTRRPSQSAVRRLPVG